MGVSSTVKLDSLGGWAFNRSKQGPKYAAAYSPKTDTIALFTPREAERHILHEFVHAVTLKAIEAGGRPALEMKRLFEHVKASGALDGMYGITNLDEFVAEAFSNPEFQRALMKVEAPVYVKGVGSGREACIRGLANNGFNLVSIKDITPIPHNGCRPRRPRRL